MRNLFDPLDQMIDLRRGTVDFDYHQCLHIEWIAGMDELLHRRNGGGIHDFHAAWNYASADDAGNAFARVLRGRKPDQHGPRSFRLLQNAHGYLRDHAQQAFRPVNEAEQIIPSGIEMFAPQAQHLACHQYDLTAENIVRGHAVFQAMHAAGIFRDIATNGTGDLRGWIGGIIKAGVSHGAAHREIGDTGFYDCDAVFEVDLTNPVEFSHAEQHAIGEGQRASG